MASVNANPRIATLNNSSLNDGFLAIPRTNALNIAPIPIPAPVKPMVANPAPINFPACGTTKFRSLTVPNVLLSLCVVKF